MHKGLVGYCMKWVLAGLAVFPWVGLDLAWAASSVQRAYPAKAVTLIIPFGLGGGSDIGARTVSRAAEKYLGKPIVIQNIEGGGSETGVSQMVRSAPDGYTIAAFNSAAVILTTMRRASYHPIKDIAPICQVVSDPRLFAVRADDSRFKTLQEFIQYARDNPDSLTIGTSGAGTSGHLVLLFVNKAVGLRARHVAFGGAGDAKAAFLGGRVDAVTQTYGEVLGMFKEGKVKILAAATQERMAELPDVPTFKESGINLVIASDRGFAAPRATPGPIIDKLADAFKRASADEAYLKQMEKMRFPVKYLGPAEFGSQIKKGYEAYGEMVKELGAVKK